MNCNRCDGKIHSGKIEKIVLKNKVGHGITKTFCRHCAAVIRYG